MSAPEHDDDDAPRGRHALAKLGENKGKIIAAGAIVALGIGAQAWIWTRPPPAPKKDPKGEVSIPRSQVKYQPPPAPEPPREVTPVAMSVPPPRPLREVVRETARNAVERDKPAGDPLAAAYKAPISTFSGGGGNRAEPVAATAGREAEEDGRELAQHLKPTRLDGARASLIRNYPYVLTKGHHIPCALETAMDSTQPGFVTVRVTQDVPGPTGLVLIDRNTLVFGEYQASIRQGQYRMGALFTRAETPYGVIVQLDSPAADALGRMGWDGEVESFFWKRLEGAALTSLVDGAFAMALTQANAASGLSLNGSKARSAADDALGGSVNIRPVLKKNQGETCSIAVGRDLDFKDVYAMKARAGR